MIDWDDYRVFLGVARRKTLSAAARQLGVDQSTIGRRLSALEAEARARLFDRTPEGYLLTAAGEAVLASVEALESNAIAIERKLLGQDARLEGRVRLATSDSFAAWFVAPRLSRLAEQHPGIVVELVTGNQPVNLARREADLSLRLTRPTQPNLIAKKLGQAAWAVYASRAYVERRGVPEPRRKFEGHALVGMDEELKGTLGARWLAEHAGRGQVACTSNSLLSQAAAVQAGLGVSPLPCVFGDARQELVRVPPARIGHHEIWLVVHPDMKTNARVRAVMDHLARSIREASALLSGRLPHARQRNTP